MTRRSRRPRRGSVPEWARARRPRLPRAWRILPIAVIVAATTAAAFTYRGAARQVDLGNSIPGGVEAPGRVVAERSIEHVTSGARTSTRYRTYRVTIVFLDASGQQHEFEAPDSSSSTRVGTGVTVSYDPRNPTRAHDLALDRTLARRTSSAATALLGVAFLVAALWSAAERRRHRRIRRGPPAASDPAG